MIIFLLRKAKFEAELNAMNWLIKWEDVSRSMTSDERKLSNSRRVSNSSINLINLIIKSNKFFFITFLEKIFIKSFQLHGISNYKKQ